MIGSTRWSVNASAALIRYDCVRVCIAAVTQMCAMQSVSDDSGNSCDGAQGLMGRPSPRPLSATHDGKPDARAMVLRMMDTVARDDACRFVEVVAAGIEVALVAREVTGRDFDADAVAARERVGRDHRRERELVDPAALHHNGAVPASRPRIDRGLRSPARQAAFHHCSPDTASGSAPAVTARSPALRTRCSRFHHRLGSNAM
jgi:hypothetical protein